MSSRSGRSFLKDNALSLTFFALFLMALLGQALTGLADFNAEMVAEGLDPISFGRYVTSSSFAVDVAENWQSEYLQFTLFIILTVWLLQRGSPESKAPGAEGSSTNADQKVAREAAPDSPRWARSGGWRSQLYGQSLGLLMLSIFLLSWLAQAVAGSTAYSAVRLRSLQNPVGVVEYVQSADFWSRTLQNWQSEFLAVASMVIFSIYLRQRGSSESKPVGEPHESTGT
jgi:hypothetical protein